MIKCFRKDPQGSTSPKLELFSWERLKIDGLRLKAIEYSKNITYVKHLTRWHELALYGIDTKFWITKIV